MEAVKAGGDRQALHEVIREHSLAAWEAVRLGQANPLADGLSADRADYPLAGSGARPGFAPC